MIKAVTAIWAIRDRLDNAINYVENDEKTIEKTFDYISKQMAKNMQLISIAMHFSHKNL